MSNDLIPVSFKAKKTGGRQKGRKNNVNVLLKQAQEQIKLLYGEGPQFKNWDPIVWLMVTAADPSVDMDLRIAAAGKAAPYIHSQVKPAEKITDNTPKMHDTEALMQRVAKDLLIENKIPIDDLILGDQPEEPELTESEIEEAEEPDDEISSNDTV